LLRLPQPAYRPDEKVLGTRAQLPADRVAPRRVPALLAELDGAGEHMNEAGTEVEGLESVAPSRLRADDHRVGERCGDRLGQAAGETHRQVRVVVAGDHNRHVREASQDA